MKITKVTMKDGVMQQPVTTTLQAEADRMHRENMLSGRELPKLIFSATFGRGGFEEVKQLTGLLVLTAFSDSEQQIGEWQRLAMQVPYTVLAYRSLNRHKLHIVVRVGFADGHEASSTTEYLQMLRQAQQQTAVIYQSLAGCEWMPEELQMNSSYAMSYDPLAQANEEAQSFPVVLKDNDLLSTYRQPYVDDNGNVEDGPTDEEREHMKEEYYTCLKKALEEHPNQKDQEQALCTLAGYCHQAHLEEEASVRRTLWQWQFLEHEDIVRKIFRAAYARNYQGKALSQMNQKERIARSIRDFFNRRYQLRYNEVKQIVEYRANDQTFYPWKPLDDRELRRIVFEDMLEGGQAWLVDIEMYVRSSFVKRYNPIMEFLGGVGTWDQKHNYIEAYARRLKTDYARWPHFFHRWLLAVVAQAMGKNRDYGNSMVPLLIGTQAMKKSTFCKNILPYSLREYYMDDIKMDNAEQVERVLGRMWLVNIDEYNAKTEREQAKIKRLLTEKDVQMRKMRSDQYVMTPRLCSFIATTNDLRPLTDPSGSRRYLCVEMTGQADMSGDINYRQMYAQAVWEIEHGVQYWFDNDDEREIMEHNAKYELSTSLDETLNNLFIAAPRTKEHFMTATDIQHHLSNVLMKGDIPTLSKLGRVLHRQHIPDGSQNGIRGYYLSLRK